MAFSPSIVPHPEPDSFLVFDQLGHALGRVWRETEEGAATDRELLLRDLMDGQYGDPVRIISFNPSEGWCSDATEEIAAELQQRCADRGEVPISLQDFLQAHGGAAEQLSLL